MKVYKLTHYNPVTEYNDNGKLIGIYSTKELAQAATQRMKDKPGFKDTMQGFLIEEYEIDRDVWMTAKWYLD